MRSLATTRRQALTLAVALVVCVVALPAGAGAATVADVDASAAAGSARDATAATNVTTTTTIRIALEEAPDGLAGYELALELPGGGTVTNASYPDAFGLTTDPRIGDDGRSVRIEAADLGDEVPPGTTDVTLARLTVSGLAADAATLRLADAQVDADGGEKIDPAALSVDAAGTGDVALEGATSNQGRSSGGPADAAGSDPAADPGPTPTAAAPGPGLGPLGLVAAAGALVAALLAGVTIGRRT